jgi:L-alanine-DL-glutamate epimerase-like enolase superfamily enzyme
MPARIDRIETWALPEYNLVRITDSDGAQGWGQTAALSARVTEAALHHIVIDRALGRAADARAVSTHVWNHAYKFRGSFLARALAGIDTALWDLQGKRAGQPVWQLLGGTGLRDIPVYLSRRTRKTTPEAEIDAIAHEFEAGRYSAVKVQVGWRLGHKVEGPADRTERLIPMLREAFPDRRLSADANGGYDAPGAIAIGKVMEAHGFYHFEEPCPFDDLIGTKAVADALTMHVTGGEQDSDWGKFTMMAQHRVVDVLQCDLAYAGGVSRAWEIGKLADAHGLGFMPHCPSMSMLQVFTLHLLTARTHHAELQEWRGVLDRQDWAEEIYTPLPVLKNGATRAPDGPGWGVEVNPDLLKRGTYRDYRCTKT